ncbi:MAG: AAA family ATPase [Gammaproteobacteria bacterium]|nr:AAA family ATPase [Gammaproteobacteria bacterium]
MHPAFAAAPVNPAELSELAALIRGGASLLVIESHDEPHAANLFRELQRSLHRPLLRWSASRGLYWVDRDRPLAASLRDPSTALVHLGQREDAPIVLLMDFHPYLDDPVVVRTLREIARAGAERRGATLVMVSTELELPPELARMARRFELHPPGADALEAMVRDEAARWGGRHRGAGARICEKTLERLINNLAGLTMKDARRLARNAIHDDGVLDDGDLQSLMQAKFELLDPDGLLNFELETARFGDVAGMPNLKRWLDLRSGVFASAEPPPGLEPPRGMLLLGVQGCGKSLAARAAAGLFGVPLLHLDFGALFNRYHGESERNLRESLRAAEQLAPCVMWIDEIEKGLASSDSDGGTSKRMLGTFLTWLAEHRSRVFVAATANDISALPPELMRKGRFDEVFFVDLPDAATRREVLSIHLARRELKPQLFPLDELAAASEGFSGAELEHVVVSALYVAHAEGQPLGIDHLKAELARTRPLSVLRREDIEALRGWASERAAPA